jgi:hypothetical protein
VKELQLSTTKYSLENAHLQKVIEEQEIIHITDK